MGKIINERRTKLVNFYKRDYDGGYILSGFLAPSDLNMVCPLIIKLKSNGDISWAKIFGNEESIGWSFTVSQNSKGEYIAAGGYIQGLSGENLNQQVLPSLKNKDMSIFRSNLLNDNIVINPLVFKIDNNGILKWAKVYGAGDYFGTLFSIRSLSNGNCVVSGGITPVDDFNIDAFVLEIDASGNPKWAKFLGYDDYLEWLYAVDTTRDNGYILSGGSIPTSTLDFDPLVVKLDPYGKTNTECDYTKDVPILADLINFEQEDITQSFMSFLYEISDINPFVHFIDGSALLTQLMICEHRLIPLIEDDVLKTGYFQFYVDTERNLWRLLIPSKDYDTGWMIFDKFRSTGKYMWGEFSNKRYKLMFNYSSSGKYHFIFFDRQSAITIKSVH